MTCVFRWALLVGACVMLSNGAEQNYMHSMVLDATNDVNISWTVRTDASEVDVRVVASMQAGGWLAIGWNNRETQKVQLPGFLMEGGDFVLGYFLPDNSPCVRVASMGKPPWEGKLQPHWWGPNGPACVHISNAAFQESNGVTSMSFTRPLTSVGGRENCLQNNNSIDLQGPQRQLYAGASSKQVPKDCTQELAPLNLKAFGHKHDLFHGAASITYAPESELLV